MKTIVSLLLLLFCPKTYILGDMYFCVLHLLLLRDPAPSALPVHTGVCAVVVEGSQRADAALLTLLPTVLRDREGGATALAG